MSIEQDILTVVRLVRLHPTELLASMRNYAEMEVKDAMASLITKRELILSSDRYLEVPIEL